MTYRYELRRSWIGAGTGLLNFIMLNPSTADDVFDDPTIRKCIGFAKSWGFSSLVVTNLFAFRATDPAELCRIGMCGHQIAVGEQNDETIVRIAAESLAHVCAWGDHGSFLGRDIKVLRLLAAYDLGCIRRTKSGNPWHPCRAPYTSAPEVFRVAA